MSIYYLSTANSRLFWQREAYILKKDMIYQIRMRKELALAGMIQKYYL